MELNPTKYKKEVSWSEEDQVFVARVPELPGCAAHGETEDEALRNLNDALVLYIESMAEHQLEKVDGVDKFLLRMPTRLKQLLVKNSNEQDLSINELLLKYINMGLESAMRSHTVGQVSKGERVFQLKYKSKLGRIKHIAASEKPEVSAKKKPAPRRSHKRSTGKTA